MHVFVHMYKSGPNNPFIPHHLDFHKPHVMHQYVHMPLNMYKKNLQHSLPNPSLQDIHVLVISKDITECKNMTLIYWQSTSHK